MSVEKPLLALTMGEPGGIAGEITLAAHKAFAQSGELAFFVIGDPDYYRAVSPKTEIAEIGAPQDALQHFSSRLPVLPLALEAPVQTGIADTAHARAVTGSISRAVELVRGGLADAMVTNPIQKQSLYEAGFRHQGHTDFLAALASNSDVPLQTVMMLSAKGLRTVPVTVHIAVRDIADTLTGEAIISQTRIVARDLERWFGIDRPRIGVAGLNPHAGENGAMGTEEQTIIEPAVAVLRSDGLDVVGPLPADTVFHDEARAAFDVIMCMYHDQALIPVKTLGFHDGVNTTLGLPIIRTSPDHGTALSLAGKNCANPSSLIAAMRQAAQMVRQQRGPA